MYSHHTLYQQIVAAHPFFVAGASLHSERSGGVKTYRSFLITTQPRILNIKVAL